MCRPLFLARKDLSFLFRLTTDPIELWASPTSRSRIERTFFEEHFRPFYRAEQVIIKALGEPFNYTDLFGNNVTFGPVFQPEFMLNLLELQKAIESIESPNGIKLVDVCNKPLSPSSEACNIQNIWAYWQDDVGNFRGKI